MGTNLAQASSALKAMQATPLDSYQGALALGQTASSLGNTLQTANQIQDQAQKIWGGTATGRAILNSPFFQQERMVTSAILPATTVAGALTDVASAQAQAGSDLMNLNETLANPNATWAMKLQASAQATQSASIYVQKQQALLNSLDSTDQAYLAQSPEYRQLMQPVQPAFRVLGRINAAYVSPIATGASIVGAGAGIIVGGFSLPGLVSGTIAAGKQLDQLINSPTATRSQKLEAVASTTRGAAGVIYAANGINAGISTLTSVAGGVKALAPAVEAVTSNPVVHDLGTVVGTAFKVLLPIADAGTMVADAVTFKDTLENPTASLGDKAKAFLEVSLDTLKVATYFFPATEGVRMAYLLASFGQMGFAMADLSKTVLPEMVRSAGHALDDIRHPGQIVQDVQTEATKVGHWFSSLSLTGVENSVSRAWHGFTHVFSQSVQLVESAFTSNPSSPAASPVPSGAPAPALG